LYRYVILTGLEQNRDFMGLAEFLARFSEGLPNSGKRWAYRDAEGCFPRQILGTPGYETWSPGHPTQFDWSLIAVDAALVGPRRFYLTSP
jgi:hypothetical protein